jgi:hypothetical protein
MKRRKDGGVACTEQPHDLVGNEEAIPEASDLQVEVREDRAHDASANADDDGGNLQADSRL